MDARTQGIAFAVANIRKGWTAERSGGTEIGHAFERVADLCYTTGQFR